MVLSDSNDKVTESSTVVSTKIPAAYHAYLRGLERMRSQKTPGNREAVRQLEHAVALDPTFTEAFVGLAEAHLFIYFNDERTAARRRLAETALRRAQTLDADSLAVQMVAGLYSLRVEEDSERAIEAFSAVAERNPRSVAPLFGLGDAARHQGHFERAIELFISGFNLIPSNLGIAGAIDSIQTKARFAGEIGKTFYAMRDYEAAEGWYSSAVEMVPDDPVALGRRVLNVLAWRGCPSPSSESGTCSTAEARLMLDSSPIRSDPRLYYLYLLLDLYDVTLTDGQDALTRCAKIVERIEATPDRPGGPGDKSYFFWLEAIAYERLGQTHRASALVRSSLKELEDLAESLPVFLARLGIAYAYLGRRDEALVAGERAVAQAQHHFYGSKRREHFAVNLVLLGEHERAISELEDLMAISYNGSISTIALRLDPTWDPLRSSPRFQNLFS